MSEETHDLVRACPDSDVKDGELTYAQEGDRYFLVTRVNGELRAYRNLCKHQFLVMEECEVAGDSFQCPYHTVRYSFATGEVTDDSGFMGIEPLTRYDARVVDGDVFIEVPKNERW